MGGAVLRAPTNVAQQVQIPVNGLSLFLVLSFAPRSFLRVLRFFPHLLKSQLFQITF